MKTWYWHVKVNGILAKIKWKCDSHLHANLILARESVWPTFACKLDIGTWKWTGFQQRLNGSVTHIWMQTWYWHVKVNGIWEQRLNWKCVAHICMQTWYWNVKVNGISTKIKWKYDSHLNANLILTRESDVIWEQRLNWSVTHICMQTWYWHVKVNEILAKIK